MQKGLVGAMAALALTMAINGCTDSSSSTGSSGGAGSGGSPSGGAGGGRISSGGAGSGGTSSGGAGSGGSRATGGSGGTSSGGAGSGGSRATGGGSGSGGQTTACTNGASCGGDLVGTWNVTSSCLSLSGDMNVELASLGCPTVPVTGSLQVTGTWTANSSKAYTDNTKTTGSITTYLAPSCLSVSSVDVECAKASGAFTALGWKTATCSTDASGRCNCSATADQSGGIGVISPSWAATNGTYTTSDGKLNTDDYVDYTYCVSGNTLTLTPSPTILPLTGTVVLQKAGTGTGGASGGAGAGGAGGATAGAGGRGGAGGATTGSGGRSGTGGATTGTGGRSGTGGATTSTGGRTGTGGNTATGGTSAGGSTGSRPCDIYAAASCTCVAAHSTVRALLSSYSGSLYRVKRASDGTFKDIGVTADGFADSAAQDTFCSTTTCTITRLYDQSGHGNYVEAETSDAEDATVRPQSGVTGHTAASATAESLNVGGHKVYSLYTKAGQAYWRDGSKSGMPLGSSPQGVYMVTSGTHYNAGCCYDYGNGETSRTYVAGPTMDAVNFSGSPAIWGSGAGDGPWIMADLEGGVFSGATTGNNPNNPSQTAKYVTAIEKNNGTTAFALRGGDATSGKLGTYYSGALPAGKNPMKKQGSIILGSGGDCCYSNTNASYGTFYEGVIVAGYPSDATDDAIQANVVSAGYGK
jgi:non-reducing end alpha-L-arabinofuranosidase